MNKKGSIIAIGIGVGLAALICLISLVFYGKVYFFDGYTITALAWMVSICSFVGGLISIIRIPPKIVSAIGVVFVILPLISPFVMPKSWDGKGLGYAIVIMLLGGIALLIYGGILSDNKNQEDMTKWESQYSNPQWRKENPKEAAAVEEKKRREHLRWNGPAVSINNLQAGYFDHGSAYRASSWSPWANSAGGWSVRYKISNIGARTIKYVTITFAAYNAVGDKCYCRTHNRTDAICRYTGPLNAGCSTGWTLNENLWYDISMSRVSVEHIYVEFMNGKSQDIYKDGKVENHGF